MTNVERLNEIIKLLRYYRHNLWIWTQENCTCGGAGPGKGCPACEAYHEGGLSYEACSKLEAINGGRWFDG